MSTLAHHTFAPWKVDGNRRIVKDKCEWLDPVYWNNENEEAHDEGLTTDRPRVLVDVDPFEDWAGDIESACRLIQTLCRGCNFWASPSVGGCKCPSPAFAKATIADVRLRLFRTIDACPNLDWLVFTRWPENIRSMSPADLCCCGSPLDGKHDHNTCGPPLTWTEQNQNVWLGVDIDDQATADERIPHLLRVPAAVRMVRYSGVGRVDLFSYLYKTTSYHVSLSVDGALKNKMFSGLRDDKGRSLSRSEAKAELLRLQADGVKMVPCGKCESFDPIEGCPGHKSPKPIDWLIISGEVGPDARPCNLEHIRDAIRQAKAAGVPVWVERLGSRVRMTWREFCQWHPNPPAVDCDPNTTDDVRFRDPHGADPAEWSEDLRIWEVPT